MCQWKLGESDSVYAITAILIVLTNRKTRRGWKGSPSLDDNCSPFWSGILGFRRPYINSNHDERSSIAISARSRGFRIGAENYHTVTIDLSAEGNQTQLSLTQDNNATEEARAHSEKNWGMMLAAMKKFLEQ